MKIDAKFINSVMIGVIISFVLIIINTLVILLSINPFSKGSTLPSIGFYLVDMVLGILIIGGTGYLAARQSRSLIHSESDAKRIGFVAGATVAIFYQTVFLVIRPVIIYMMGHPVDSSWISLVFSLIYGLIIVMGSLCLYGLISIIGSYLYYSRNIRTRQEFGSK